TAPYTYSWSNGTTGVPNLNNLLAGDYSLTVTDANGCTANSATTIGEGASITVGLTPTNPTCTGTNEGSITANPSGGSAPYVYSWSNGETTATVNNLPAGSYEVTVTDDNGCSTTGTASISEPTPFAVSIISTTREICAGGSINFGSTPSDPTLTYQWTATGGAFDDATSATPTYTMMMSGTYEIILTASNGTCTATETITVTVSQGPTVAMTLSDVICAGDSTGSINVTASSDNEPITYTWDNGIGNIPNPTNLLAGTYNLTITDAAGCTIDTSATIGEISNLSLNTTPSNLVCSGDGNGSITATTSGGIEPITFAWSNGAGNVATINNLTAGTYTVTATDAMGCSKIATTTISEPTPFSVTINNSAAGTMICGGTPVNLAAIPTDGSLTYSWTASGGSFNDATSATPIYTMMMSGTHEIIVVASNGTCTATDTTYVTIGEVIDFTIAQTDISCIGEMDGSITVTVNSGVAPFTYTWDNGIGNISNPTGLAAGTYNLTITDGNNCESTASVTINDAVAIVTGLIGTNILCNGDNTGTVDALIVGGATPLSLAWSNGATNVESINNLSAGTYVLTITDANNCTAIDSVTLTEPTALTAETEGANVGCNGADHAHLTVTGGISPYTYLWDDALNQTTDTAFNLVAGNYNVTVTDANGCTMVETIAIVESGAITCEIKVLNDIKTFNGSEGALGVAVTGGSGNYTYHWNNGERDSVINDLSTNTYIVTITDETGCTCVDTFQFLNPAILGNFVWEDTDSNGVQDIGEPGIPGVTLQVSGTTYYDEMLVQTIQTDSNGLYQFNLPPGGYKVTVVDALGFTFTEQDAGGVGGDDTIDSDFNPNNNMSQIVTLAPNDVNLTIDLGLYPSTICQNILTGGAVKDDELLCGLSGDPTIITNLFFPTGGVGQLEYLWLKSDVTMEYYPGHPDWMEIPNSNAQDYDPGVITKTTYFIRCVRRKGCNSYPGESNIITKTIIDCAANLFVENLRTTTTAGQVELVWDGKIPYDNGNFIIERSTNGIDFKVVSTMASPISETMDEFHYMDEVPKLGENYYRIKTFVPSMESNYSNIAMAIIKPNSTQKVMFYPNPVQHDLTVHFLEKLDKPANLHIVNSFGQVMKILSLDTTNPRHQVDISELPSGMYYLRFDNRKLKRLGQKIYKVEE
ncbi:MAG: SdrD B-like domain-containing protein, partial [Saprospiraceae bacterium]